MTRTRTRTKLRQGWSCHSSITASLSLFEKADFHRGSPTTIGIDDKLAGTGAARYKPGMVALQCHPRTPTGAGDSVDITVERRQRDLVLRATHPLLSKEGARGRSWSTSGTRADGLWNHTCIEAFLRLPGEPGYHEINLAPSGDWQIYRFREYRELLPLPDIRVPPCIAIERSHTAFVLEARLDLVQLDPRYGSEPLQLALAAVLEEQDGRLSYWALAHPDGAPDFHHPDAFRIRL